ncbi:MAG: DUF2090 domain-containing protein [Chlamydiia bacterium]|nr:DUF2090 domain-containing protein [Chlamydiia bacterium]
MLGAGDAFLAGLLRGWLKGEDWEVSAAWANACGSLVVGRHGCAPAIPYWQELNAFMDASLNAAEIEVLHQSLNRRQHPKTPLYVLAFDHHDAFEEWESVLAPAQIQSLKRLIYGSLEQLHLRMEDTAFGLIIDDRYGSEVLSACEGKGLWIARAWKSPLLERGSVGAAQDPALAFRNWPRHHVVKILWRPEPASRSRQLRELFKVHEAATAWGLELLIEVIRPEQERHDLLQDMRDVYSKGIQVAWWKLPPYQDPVWWADCRKLIADEDPMSHGVLALGQGLAPAELLTRLRELRAVHAIEGCAVGRSFWLDPCRRYMRGEMTERECEKAIAQLVSGFVEGLSHESIKGG